MALQLLKNFRFEVVTGKDGEHVQQHGDRGPAVPYAGFIHEIANLFEELFQTQENAHAFVQGELKHE